MRRGVVLVLASLSGCGAKSGIAAGPPPICLASYAIDHTDTPDDSTILFFMRDHTVYRNHLERPCFGLSLDPRGFTYEATDPGSDTICSNLVLIRTNTDHNSCALGAFVKIPRPPHA